MLLLLIKDAIYLKDTETNNAMNGKSINTENMVDCDFLNYFKALFLNTGAGFWSLIHNVSISISI